MKRPPRRSSSRPPAARDRLLAAAARVFARDGLAGATTRAIALEAGVNEVTLFRLFKSKDRLLGAVIGQNFGPEAGRGPLVLPAPTGELREDLLALARVYDALLEANLPLVRTMIGEIHRHRHGRERQVFQSIFLPVKIALLARLRVAARDRKLRAEAEPEILTDLLVGMIFTGVLRRASAHVKAGYGPAVYLGAAVDLIMDGAAVRRSRR
ncbi:MAG: transcriptional regulator, TetR family [Verrucomicrobia bacterium]|nr:transcriptional regulator, TetR family [Verrucomicrobiota bacterium]